MTVTLHVCRDTAAVLAATPAAAPAAAPAVAPAAAPAVAPASAPATDPTRPRTLSTQSYIAKNNEKPIKIAKQLGVDVHALIALNVEQYPGLKPGSKLMANTYLRVPGPAFASAPEPPLKKAKVEPQPNPKAKAKASAAHEVIVIDSSDEEEPMAV